MKRIEFVSLIIPFLFITVSITWFVERHYVTALIFPCFVAVLLGAIYYWAVVQNSKNLERVKRLEREIENIERLKNRFELEQVEKTPNSSMNQLINNRIQYAGKKQELMMLHAKPRADRLFTIGIFMLSLSLIFPIASTLIYYQIQPISDDTITAIVNLKKGIGELPKELNLSVGRDWHILLGGITFGFLCLAAAKGILTQQASEMKTYFELGQKVRYFERLNSVAELILTQDENTTDKRQELINSLADRLLINYPVTKEESSNDFHEESLFSKVLTDGVMKTS